ncbi:hypothetical protein EBI01_18020 [Marinomonas rhizomae]|nr:hypothetical protein EBI01_18020 [Marinomonas rhizomae]
MIKIQVDKKSLLCSKSVYQLIYIRRRLLLVEVQLLVRAVLCWTKFVQIPFLPRPSLLILWVQVVWLAVVSLDQTIERSRAVAVASLGAQKYPPAPLS